MFNWYKKEKPFFTGIARGVGGFGFGASAAAGGGAAAVGGFGFLASAAGPGSGTGYYEVIIDGAGTTGTTFTSATAYLWATSDAVAVQWLTDHGFVVGSPSNARQVTTSRTHFTIDASSIPSDVKVIAYGAGGGHGAGVPQPLNGNPYGTVAAEGGTMHLTGGFTPGPYMVVIGQGGQQSLTVGWNLGGYGGGGSGRQNRGSNHAGGGGGLTGLYQPSWTGGFAEPSAITNAYLIAGGGGGGGYTGMGYPTPAPWVRNLTTRVTNGGSGGYPRGDDGLWYSSDQGGRGGTQSSPGPGVTGRTPGAYSDAGSYSRGGNGVNATSGGSGDGNGGGGGGYRGGGGGGPIVGSGGGGSGFAPAPSTKTGYYGWDPLGGWGINGKGTVRGVAGSTAKFGTTPYNDPDSSGAGGLIYIYV